MNCLIRHSRIGSFVLQCKPRCNVLQSVRNTFVVCIAIIVCRRLQPSAPRHAHLSPLNLIDRYSTPGGIDVRKEIAQATVISLVCMLPSLPNETRT